jgi:hypothetical protein
MRVGFERLASGGGEEDAVESEGIRGGTGDGDVAAVRWVEGSAEEGYTHLKFVVVRRKFTTDYTDKGRILE